MGIRKTCIKIYQQNLFSELRTQSRKVRSDNTLSRAPLATRHTKNPGPRTAGLFFLLLETKQAAISTEPPTLTRSPLGRSFLGSGKESVARFQGSRTSRSIEKIPAALADDTALFARCLWSTPFPVGENLVHHG